MRYISKEGHAFEGALRSWHESTSARKSLSIIINDSKTWNTEQFLAAVWKAAGAQVVEVKLAETWNNPNSGKLHHRYDFVIQFGHGFRYNHPNVIMWEIEQELMKNPNVDLGNRNHKLGAEKVLRRESRDPHEVLGWLTTTENYTVVSSHAPEEYK